MKAKNALMLAAILSFSGMCAQATSDIFSASGPTITWLGVDFSQVKIVGDMQELPQYEIVDLFRKMNDVVVAEWEKYNLRWALDKTEIPFDLDPVNAANHKLAKDEMISQNSLESGRVTKETIQSSIKSYSFNKKEGIGLIFFMEGMEKHKQSATMWVTFFNFSNGEILLTERMTGAVGGFGLRNYWVRPVYNVIQEIQKHKYKSWKTTYGK